MSLEYNCTYCNKVYVKKAAYNNHLLNCKFIRICNNIKTNSHLNDNTNDNDYDNTNDNHYTQLDIKYDGTVNDLYKLLINLNNKFEKLQNDYDELKKYVNITKNKINVLEYLNNNFCDSLFDFNLFLDSISITSIELQIIFDKDYVDGIVDIIINYINKIKENDKFVPIKAFNNKENILYVYLKSQHSNDHKWIVMDDDIINIIMKYFNRNLLPLFTEWKELYKDKVDPDSYTTIYVKNMKRVLASNFEKKNKHAMLKNKLYKYLKVDLKNFAIYDSC
tara:strand:+ start:3161 stop:3994 length:834 start_codon:yes stop_codon:yes gene_type:complete